MAKTNYRTVGSLVRGRNIKELNIAEVNSILMTFSYVVKKEIDNEYLELLRRKEHLQGIPSEV